MGGKTGTTTGLALLLAAGMAWASGTPSGREIVVCPLLPADSGEAVTETPDGLDLTAEQEAQLWQEAQPIFDQLKQSPGEINAMWIPNLQGAGLLAGAVATVIAATPVQAADNYVFGRCKISRPDSGVEIRPTYDGGSYLFDYHGEDPRYQPGLSSGEFFAGAKVTLIKAPAHGKLVLEKGQWKGEADYHYYPNEGYIGKDRFVMQLEKDGVKVRIQYLIQGLDNDEPSIGICNPESWKISSTLTDPSSLQSILTRSGLDGSAVTLQVADLTGSAVGQTTNTTITLDTNAAGHGWYIDYTPYLNEEYLPTSNPYEWIAKEGTDAYGKMDLLSVLWHEYGHAMGLDHSADSHDLMAATLAPGVRRLPDAETLAEFRRMLGYSLAGDNLPTTPDIPQPDGPLSPNNGRNSNVRVARARITREGTFVIGEDGVEREQTEYQAAANPTLTDPRLETGTGWEMTGNVSLGNGAAILSESPTSQTRLNQVFLVGEHDRYLTFTLAGIGLDDVLNGPDDAFEAALLDANSGAALLGGTGLTRNDAFLNLQADGAERAGQGVTSTRNADGSRTYRVDLAGIPAGTAVNLSFDLLGFGAATSQVTVRDIRLGVPETRDDSATTAEDTPIDIAVTANDLDADQPGFAPVVVTGPQHGSLTLNAEGGFTYTPDADWHGADSFTYKLSDGTVDSNLATVSLTVAAVNDAPTAGDQTLATLEDTVLTLDLLANASDIDSPSLTPVVVSGPQHGTLTQTPDGGFSYTPEANWDGTDRIEYKVGDGETAVDTSIRRAA